MNEAIAFDTLRFAKYLAENGFTEQQAETMAKGQVRFLNTNLALKTDLAKVEADLKADIARVETGLIKWMVGVGLGVAALQTTVIVGLLS